MIPVILLLTFLVSKAFPATLPKIIGGNPGYPGEFPHIVSIQVAAFDGAPFEPICGGVIISTSVILSVAHCTLGQDPEEATYQIVAGEYDLSVTEGTEQFRIVRKIVLHEYFDKRSFRNDVALFFLEEPLTFNGFVGAASLPPASSRVKGLGVVAGWGQTENEGSGRHSDVLNKLTIPFHPDATCEEIYGESFDKKTMLCAGSKVGGEDACPGDSGGPIVKSGGRGAAPIVAGLVSWGPGSYCGTGLPSVYSRVSHFVDWIKYVKIACSKDSNIC